MQTYLLGQGILCGHWSVKDTRKLRFRPYVIIERDHDGLGSDGCIRWINGSISCMLVNETSSYLAKGHLGICSPLKRHPNPFCLQTKQLDKALKQRCNFRDLQATTCVNGAGFMVCGCGTKVPADQTMSRDMWQKSFVWRVAQSA